MAVATSNVVAEFCRRTPGSARLAAEARGLFPSGIAHDSRRLVPYPIYIARAEGSRKWDVDGNEYVDYAGGHGALLFGHNHPPVVAAIERQLTLGTHYGSCHEGEIQWAKAVRNLIPSCERIRFTNSGTEATLLAMRLARAFTHKSKIVRFARHFHGWHDHAAFGVSSHFDGTPTPGVPWDLTRDINLVEDRNLAALEETLSAKDIAAVIVEPTGASWGQVPLRDGFLKALRELTAARGIILIFDEVISGFRCSPGGAQAVFNVRPDLTTLAKILAGGLPGGAVGGREDIMHWLAFPADVDPSHRPAYYGHEKIPHYGTFNANPLSAAAGVATLDLVATTDACQRANHYAQQLRERLNQVFAAEEVPWIAYGSFSGFHFFTNPAGKAITQSEIERGEHGPEVLKAATRPDLINRFRLGMLLHGVDMLGWPGGPTSALHTNADLEQTVSACRETLRMLRAEALL